MISEFSALGRLSAILQDKLNVQREHLKQVAGSGYVGGCVCLSVCMCVLRLCLLQHLLMVRVELDSHIPGIL